MSLKSRILCFSENIPPRNTSHYSLHLSSGEKKLIMSQLSATQNLEVQEVTLKLSLEGGVYARTERTQTRRCHRTTVIRTPAFRRIFRTRRFSRCLSFGRRFGHNRRV